MRVRDRGLPKQMITKLWTEAGDHAEDEIAAWDTEDLRR